VTAVIMQFDIKFSVRPVIKMLSGVTVCTDSTDLL